MLVTIFQGTMIPFLGTSLGAAMVFLLKKQLSENIQKVLTGFAAGVMVAASFWSLLQPALESSAHLGKLSFLPAAIGFLVGIGFLGEYQVQRTGKYLLCYSAQILFCILMVIIIRMVYESCAEKRRKGYRW